MLKALIVDDEQHCIDRLVELLQDYNDSVQLLAACTTIDDAKEKIKGLQPDVVFLDVHLHDKTGFDLLEGLKESSFELVFTTAYDNYALEAFRYSAMDYLLKPVDKEEFHNTIQKILEREGLKNTSKKLEVLFHNFEHKVGRSKKVAIPTLEGLTLLVVDHIIRLQSDGNYTNIFLQTGKKVTATKTLKYFEKIMENQDFFRVHKSHLIQLSYVDKYIKGKGGYVLMSDGSTIEVATRRKDELLKKLMD